MIGRTQQPWYRRYYRPSILDRLLRELPNVDVMVAAAT
jgi:K+-sensing histidine kinase KdpD